MIVTHDIVTETRRLRPAGESESESIRGSRIYNWYEYNSIPSQLGPLARPGPEAAVEIVIAECSAILLWPF